MIQLFNRYIFSASVAVNMFSMTVLMIALTFLGHSDVAADVGLVHGATMAVFFAFSANARNIILGNDNVQVIKKLFYFRLLLVFPLAVVAYFLSQGVAGNVGLLTFALIIRRCCEWIAELQISEREKNIDQPYAWRFFLFQLSSLILLLTVYNFQGSTIFFFALGIWVLSPCLQIVSFVLRTCSLPSSRGKFHIKSFLPHVGSTWIVAISTYIFRLFIILLVGKNTAGVLFSAYAIGGMVNSVYTYAIGPTLRMQVEPKSGVNEAKYTYFMVLFLIVIGLIIISLPNLSIDSFIINDTLFIYGIGYSLIGAGLMIMAQRRRIYMLQTQGLSVFVPDVLANITIIAIVPLVFFMFGQEWFATLFLLNSCVTVAIYFLPSSGERMSNIFTEKRNGKILTRLCNRETIQFLVIFFLFIPIFFLLNGQIFYDEQRFNGAIFDSLGNLYLLPLPLSIIACCLGAMFLLRFDKVNFSSSFLFSFFAVLIMSTFISIGSGFSTNQADSISKLSLLLQFVMPVFGLVLGQSYIEPKKIFFRFESIALLVIILIVPIQVFATLEQEVQVLTPYLYYFSIYQHLQYIPVVFIGLFFLALLSLPLDRWLRFVFLVLAPFIGVYSAASLSITVFLTVIFCSVISIYFLTKKGLGLFIISLSLILIASMVGHFMTMNADPTYVQKFGTIEQKTEYAIPDIIADVPAPVMKKYIPGNLTTRQYYMKMYLDGVLSSPTMFFFGHPKRPDRQIMPSAHNYYLDLIYNFGFVAVVPFLYLIFITVRYCYYCIFSSAKVSLRTTALAFLIILFILVDNSLKVSFRQPYSGLIMFFLWGVFLSRMSSITSASKTLPS